jgi:phosphatidylethanolamine-binding protein (PEBP) family uncharacterized protein
MKKLTTLFSIFFLLNSSVSFSEEKFQIEFEWGNIRNCTDGNPNTVTNPIFKLINVPKGTAHIQFTMIDTDVPGYYHGGGKVDYVGQKTIEPGVFKYSSPCPPMGSHKYKWNAYAKNDKNEEIGKASAIRNYPEK